MSGRCCSAKHVGSVGRAGASSLLFLFEFDISFYEKRMIMDEVYENTFLGNGYFVQKILFVIKSKTNYFYSFFFQEKIYETQNKNK